MSEHDDRSKPEPSELEGRPVAPSPVDPADSTEVERLRHVVRDTYRRVTDAILTTDDDVLNAHEQVARAVLADLRKRYVLVLLEGATQECWTEWGLRWEDELDGPGHTPESARAERDRVGVPGDMGEVVRREVTHVRTREGDEVAVYRSWQVAE